MVRVLRKRRLNVNDSTAALIHTLEWRKTFLPTLGWPQMEKLLGSAFVRIRSHLTRAGHTVIYVQANAGGHLSTEEKAVAPHSSLL